MKRIIIIAAAAIMFAGTSVPEAHAQFRGNRGLHRGHKSNFGMRGNRLNRFGGAFAGQSTGSTLFDLYRNGQIPVPPYFALHPPVYYNGIDYQRYGSTPFAYPHTWWQQYGYGYNHGPPPISTAGPTAAPLVIENPHTTNDASLPEKSKDSDATVAAVIINPFVSENAVNVNLDHVGPLMVANRHIPTTQTLDDSVK